MENLSVSTTLQTGLTRRIASWNQSTDHEQVSGRTIQCCTSDQHWSWIIIDVQRAGGDEQNITPRTTKCHGSYMRRWQFDFVDDFSEPKKSLAIICPSLKSACDLNESEQLTADWFWLRRRHHSCPCKYCPSGPTWFRMGWHFRSRWTYKWSDRGLSIWNALNQINQ